MIDDPINDTPPELDPEGVITRQWYRSGAGGVFESVLEIRCPGYVRTCLEGRGVVVVIKAEPLE
jgi:hypothetical protein